MRAIAFISSDVFKDVRNVTLFSVHEWQANVRARGRGSFLLVIVKMT